MRILILSDRIPPENVGGAEKVAWSLAGGLRDAGHDVHVAAATPHPAFKAVRDGLPTYHLHVPPYRDRFHAYLSLYNPAVVAGLRRLYAEVQPDIVHAHNIHAQLTYYSLVLARHVGLPTVFTSHDVMPFAYQKLTRFIDPARCGVESPEQYRLPTLYNLKQMRLRYNPLRNLLIRTILTRSVLARTCVSEAHRQALEANGLPPFQVVYNGLKPEALHASAAAVDQLRARLGVEGRRVILFAGRLTREKGSVQLLAALEQLVNQVPDALLLLLTRKSLEEQGITVPSQLRDTHLRSGGWLEGESLAAAYQLADVVVMPSICFDTLGMVSLEAMAAGKPVVATCYGGSPEVVVDGETGYVVNPFDIEALANRLERLLLDADLRQRLGAAGQRRLADRFTLSRQVGSMVNIYEQISSF